MPILAKNIIFSDEAHFDPGGYVNKQNFHIWGTEHPNAYIEKRTLPKRVTVWYHLLAHLSSKMSQERPLQPMAILIGPCWTNFCSLKLKLVAVLSCIWISLHFWMKLNKKRTNSHLSVIKAINCITEVLKSHWLSRRHSIDLTFCTKDTKIGFFTVGH